MARIKAVEAKRQLEEANKWYHAKVQEHKGASNVLQLRKDNNEMSRKMSDYEQEEDEEEEDDDNEEGRRQR